MPREKYKTKRKKHSKSRSRGRHSKSSSRSRSPGRHRHRHHATNRSRSRSHSREDSVHRHSSGSRFEEEATHNGPYSLPYQIPSGMPYPYFPSMYFNPYGDRFMNDNGRGEDGTSAKDYRKTCPSISVYGSTGDSRARPGWSCNVRGSEKQMIPAHMLPMMYPYVRIRLDS